MPHVPDAAGEETGAALLFLDLLVSHARAQDRFTCVVCNSAQSIKQVMFSSSRFESKNAFLDY
jgi:hypothetical protein